MVRIRVADIALHGVVRTRATVVQRKTGRPVQFEITEQARASIQSWLSAVGTRPEAYLFPSRVDGHEHVSTRQYARLIDDWVRLLGLDQSTYGTYSLRRTKAALIYKHTGNLRAVQLLLGHITAGEHGSLSWN